MVTKVYPTPSDDGKSKSPAAPPLVGWPQRPVMLQPVYGSEPHCPVNQVFDLESDLFQGQALIRIRSNACLDPYFAGRQRKYQFIIQGRFRQDLPVTDVVSGGEFFKPLSMRPPRFIHSKLRDILRLRNPGFELDLCSDDNPRVFAPLVSAMQHLRADAPGQEPDMVDLWRSKEGVKENNRGFGPEYARDIDSSATRRKLMAKNDRHYKFSTEWVYTFEGYDEMVDFDTYKVDLKLMNADMLSFLPDGVPMPILAKSRSLNKCLWGWNVWHERLMKG